MGNVGGKCPDYDFCIVGNGICSYHYRNTSCNGPVKNRRLSEICQDCAYKNKKCPLQQEDNGQNKTHAEDACRYYLFNTPARTMRIKQKSG